MREHHNRNTGTDLLQSILAGVQPQLRASFFKDITEMFSRCYFDSSPSSSGIDHYDMRSHSPGKRVHSPADDSEK